VCCQEGAGSKAKLAFARVEMPHLSHCCVQWKLDHSRLDAMFFTNHTVARIRENCLEIERAGLSETFKDSVISAENSALWAVAVVAVMLLDLLPALRASEVPGKKHLSITVI